MKITVAKNLIHDKYEHPTVSPSVYQPHQSCLDSPPHPLVNPSLSSSPLSSSFTLSRHVAQYSPTGSETTPPYAPRSSRFGSESPSVEDDVDIWRYAILELHDRNDDDE